MEMAEERKCPPQHYFDSCLSDAHCLPQYKEYKSNYETQQSWRGPPKIGGDMFDITKMTRQERAEAAFDKKDPLAHISDADLRKGKFQLGWSVRAGGIDALSL